VDDIINVELDKKS